MKLELIDKKYITSIKIISIVLISSAIALEIWNIITRGQIANSLRIIFTIERIAVISHFIEGIIASFYAKNKLSYSIYVFFVGTVGLLELFPAEPVKK